LRWRSAVPASSWRLPPAPTAKRSALYPDIPTVAESGLPGYQADAWYGVLVPARTPTEIVQRLNREVHAVLKTPDFPSKVAAQGAEVTGSTPDEFAAFMRLEIAKWVKVTSRLKIQPE